ncbi:MAG: thioredoxin domain-containing protein [Akkermansiaceae bacterium]|nr:thioredoxin domain-containing protein [Akkermansiaceae bacterium]
MNQPKSFGRLAMAGVLCGLLLVASACRKRSNEEAAKSSTSKPVMAKTLLSNELGAFPGPVYKSQANSPIHWQPWTQESMSLAKKANRLVLAVIVIPQQPGFQRVLKDLESNTAIVDMINNNFIPVLVDGDAAHEVGILTADLCAEIKRGLQLPLFVWLTPAGNPVAWIPVPPSNSVTVSELFNGSNSMISRMWSEDSAYVLKNSALDNSGRRGRISERKNTKVMSQNPAEDVIIALRQLISLYDPFSHTFDESGGLFPSSAISLLATASIAPSLPQDIRLRCKQTTTGLLTDLLQSAMFDPLEGGVFTSRMSTSWSLPTFYRDCGTQARVAVALIDGYRATGDPQALSKALEVISFAEKTFKTPDGLFAVGLAPVTDTTSWLWKTEDINKELSPEDAAWWIAVTGMKGLGNLPSDTDPMREYFRCNSISINKSVAQIAEDLGQPLETFAPRYEQVRKTLLKVRSTRLGSNVPDDCPQAGATFRMVSAYAAAFEITGDEIFREKAVSLLSKARTAFTDGPRLRMFSQSAPSSIGEGRAFLYALALQAVLDVSSITSDETWLDWCENLATTAAELFTDAEYLKECPDEAKIIDLPITDLVMLFEDSTAGLFSSAELRLKERQRPLVSTFSALSTPLPSFSSERPTIHTDLLLATLARENKITVIVDAAVSPELRLSVERLPLKLIQRRAANASDNVPTASIKIIIGKNEPIIVSTPEALKAATTPSPSH